MGSSDNVNSVLSKKTCDVCDITDIKKADHGGGFIFRIKLKNMSTNSSGDEISSGESFFFFKTLEMTAGGYPLARRALVT